MAQEQRIEQIVIEGGPAGGKSTVIPILKHELKKDGWMVLVSSEVPTRLINEHDYVLEGEGKNIDNDAFQRLVLKHVIEQEDALRARALESGHPKVVILCDRGLFGGAAYVSPADFFRMARDCFGMSRDDMYGRYGGCVFLLSPASDRPDIYKKVWKSNPARRERTVKAAAAQNARSLDACVGVDRLFIVQNDAFTFDEKVKKVVAVVRHLLSDQEIERKWTSNWRFTPEVFQEICARWGIYSIPIRISQTYLTLSDEDKSADIKERRVRARQMDSAASRGSFTLTKKGAKQDGAGTEEEMQISLGKYRALRREADPSKVEIKKTRFCFVYGAWYYEFDIFDRPRGQAAILERELLPGENADGVPDFLSFLGILRDVTDDPAFSNKNIAKRPV